MTSISYCTSFCKCRTQHSPFPSPIEFAVFRITTGKQSRDDPLAKGFRSFTTFPSHRWFPMDRTGFPFQSHNRPQPTFTHSNSPKSIPWSPEPFALCRFPCNPLSIRSPANHHLLFSCFFGSDWNANHGPQRRIHENQNAVCIHFLVMKELLKQTLETYRVGVGDSSNAVETTSV